MCSSFYYFVLFSFCVAAAVTVDTYTDMYDNIDIDAILRNQRMYKSYLTCLTEGKKCTPEAKQLKDMLPEAFSTACAKCTEKQRIRAKKVIKYLMDEKPDDYIKLEKIYDPDKTLRQKYKKEASEFGM